MPRWRLLGWWLRPLLRPSSTSSSTLLSKLKWIQKPEAKQASEIPKKSLVCLFHDRFVLWRVFGYTHHRVIWNESIEQKQLGLRIAQRRRGRLGWKRAKRTSKVRERHLESLTWQHHFVSWLKVRRPHYLLANIKNISGRKWLTTRDISLVEDVIDVVFEDRTWGDDEWWRQEERRVEAKNNRVVDGVLRSVGRRRRRRGGESSGTTTAAEKFFCCFLPFNKWPRMLAFGLCRRREREGGEKQVSDDELKLLSGFSPAPSGQGGWQNGGKKSGKVVENNR